MKIAQILSMINVVVATDPTCNVLKSLYQTTQSDGKSCCDDTLKFGDIVCGTT